MVLEMKRKAVFMDIDGTLMGHNGVSGRVIDAIQRTRSRGNLFFVCTGRSLGNMPGELLQAEYLDGYIMGCGMHCVFGNRDVYHERISRELVLEVAKFSFERRQECWYEGETRMLATYSEFEQIEKFDTIEMFADAIEKEPISKMTIQGPYREEYGVYFSKWFDLYAMGTYSDVVLRGVTKATGMQHMLDYLNIDKANCIGVGDSLNDLPMIEFAGLGVAMGNAPEAVKARADVVTDTCQNDGVATMIERYVLR